MDNFMDNVKPKLKWEFNAEVASCFDNMLQRSIPSYERMRELTAIIGLNHLSEEGTVIDLGCSAGRSLEPFVVNGHKCFGLEISEPMRKQACKLLASDTLSQILDWDITQRRISDHWISQYVELVLSILTIQFTPIEYRQTIISDVYSALPVGGMFIFVEKILGNCAETNDLLVETYKKEKFSHGYSEEDIRRKAKALEGVLVPVTAKWNEDMLYSAGFKNVEMFFRDLNFCGWIALK